MGDLITEVAHIFFETPNMFPPCLNQKTSGKPDNRVVKHRGNLIKWVVKHRGNRENRVVKHRGNPIIWVAKHRGNPIIWVAKHRGNRIIWVVKHWGNPKHRVIIISAYSNYKTNFRRK